MAQSKYFSKIIAVMMILVSFVSMFSISSSAATSGGERSATITVTTKANYWYPGASSIKLQQTKQTATYGQFTTGKTKTTTDYFGYYNITVSPTTNCSTRRISPTFPNWRLTVIPLTSPTMARKRT